MNNSTTNTAFETDQEYLLSYNTATKAHEGVFRRNGITPYFHHCLDVSQRVKKFGLKTTCVGLLHDTIEDNDKYSAEKLIEIGIHKDVVDTVVILTHLNGEDYFEVYLPRVKANRMAKRVKIYDIISNLADNPTNNQLKKYGKALAFLTDGEL